MDGDISGESGAFLFPRRVPEFSDGRRSFPTNENSNLYRRGRRRWISLITNSKLFAFPLLGDENDSKRVLISCYRKDNAVFKLIHRNARFYFPCKNISSRHASWHSSLEQTLIKKPGFHMSGKSQTIGDFTVSRLSQSGNGIRFSKSRDFAHYQPSKKFEAIKQDLERAPTWMEIVYFTHRYIF